VTLLGYCLGGVLALLALARDPELPVRNLVCMATPVDFSHMQAMTALVREGRLDPEDVVDDTGNVPPEAVESAFRMLKPTAEVSQYATLWENLWNDQYMEGYQAMGRWTRDHVPFPGAAFRQIAEQFVRTNGLVEGTVRLSGRDVDLSAITCPVLNVVAERDHIVPIGAAEPLPRLVGSEEAEELRLHAGHVGLVAGRAAAKVTLPSIAGWIQAHSDPVEEAR
jgi:polyhydroxyalkanoate synthase